MSNHSKLYLHPGRERSIQRYHLWVFSGAVRKIAGDPVDGDWVEIYDDRNKFLAAGHYGIGSIMVRIQSFDQVEPDDLFWEGRIKNAVDLRKKIGFFDHPGLNVFRLINGEGDGMPGLIVDFYNDVVVIQCHTIGMYREIEDFASIFKKLIPDIKAIYDKSYQTLSGLSEKKGRFLYGKSGPVLVSEYENKFEVDFIHGQKTGFFIDQRENRMLLGEYARGKSVLNTFCYTGGFSVYAATHDALRVVSVDVSEKAIQQADKNFQLNGIDVGKYENKAIDVFEYLEKTDQQFDVMVLDPPAFAKHQNVLKNALKGYRKLNEIAISRVGKGGIIFTFSCSQLVNKDDFRLAVFTAASNAKRKVRILQQLNQPADHPVNIYHPESEYLKGLVLYVE